MRVLTVVGARPEFIKSLPLSRALAGRGIEELVVHTGQHYDADMSDVFYDELGLPTPWGRLSTGGGTHAEQTASMLIGLEAACNETQPDWVVVYGDTNSTLAGGLAAAKLHVAVAHVEAGLRSFNRAMPEELNRVLVDHLSSVLFAPTPTAVGHLLREGIEPARIELVGDVNYDATLLISELLTDGAEGSDLVDSLGITGPYAVATAHRAETTDDRERLVHVMEGLEMVAREVDVILPLHPRTRAALDRHGIELSSSRLHVIDPVGFIEMVSLMRGAAVVATDSGGVQKEALFLKVPCATLRTETEWVETIELGWNRLVPLDSAEAVATGVVAAIGTAGDDVNPYGDGRAADLIASVLASDGRAAVER